MHADPNLYRRDCHAWLAHQAELLRQGRIEDIDSDLLAEELDAMGRRERNALVSRLIVLVARLLAWQYRAGQGSASWRGSIVEQRVQIARELRLSPSLKPFLAEAVAEAYPDALRVATQETGLDAGRFPQRCPFPADAILDEDYWPAASSDSN